MTKNQFTKYTTTFVIIGGLGLVTISGVISANAHGLMGSPNKNPEVQKALIDKDLNAYKQAVLTDKTKSTQAKLDTITQDTLNAMSDNYIKMQAIDTKITDAIKAGDKLDDYKTALKQQKTLRDIMHAVIQANLDGNINKTVQSSRPKPTDAQLEKRYNQQVARYKKDGTLPMISNKAGDITNKRSGGMHNKRTGHHK